MLELIPYNAEKRIKRGVLNFVEKINKMLFGTLDSDDGKRIYSKTNNLENSTLKLAELADERIHIIKSGFQTHHGPTRIHDTRSKKS